MFSSDGLHLAGIPETRLRRWQRTFLYLQLLAVATSWGEPVACSLCVRSMTEHSVPQLFYICNYVQDGLCCRKQTEAGRCVCVSLLSHVLLCGIMLNSHQRPRGEKSGTSLSNTWRWDFSAKTITFSYRLCTRAGKNDSLKCQNFFLKSVI